MRPIKLFIILLVCAASVNPSIFRADADTNTNDLLSLIAGVASHEKKICLQHLEEIYRTKDYTAVVKACDEAITSHPDWGEVYAQRATANLRLKNYTLARADAEKSVRLAPSYAPSHFALARAASENDDNVTALAEIGKACGLDPSNLVYLTTRAYEKRYVNDTDGAIADLTRAIKLSPRSSFLYRERGLTRWIKLPDSAIADFDHAIELTPRDAEAWAERALLKSLLNQSEAAERDIQKALELSSTNIDTLYAYARIKASDKDYSAIRKIMDQVIALDPKQARFFELRGTARDRLGDHDGAREDFNQAQKLSPHNAGATSALALSEQRAGHASNAIADFTRAIQSDPGSAYYRLLRANAYRREGRETEAFADAKEAIELDPHDADAFEFIAILFERKHEYNVALSNINIALGISPITANFYIDRARIFGELERYDKALEDAETAVRLAPTNASAFIRQGRVHYVKHDYAKAVDDFTAALKWSPTNAFALRERSLVYARLNQLTAAFADAQRAINLDPTNADALIRRGYVLMWQHKYPEALADFGRATELDPRNERGWEGRASLKSKTGDFPGALADCGKAIEFETNWPSARAERARILYERDQSNDLSAAIEDLLRIISDARATTNDRDYAHLNLWIMRKRLGQSTQAVDELKKYLATRTDTAVSPWTLAMLRFIDGVLSEKELLSTAQDLDSVITNEQLCEAWYYIGSKHFAGGDQATAREDFKKCLGTGSEQYYEFASATALLKTLGTNP